MDGINFTGTLYCDKSIDKLSKTMSEGIKNTVQSFLSVERIQQAIPEDIYISVPKTKECDTLVINIKDAADTKLQTILIKDGNNNHIIKNLLAYLWGRYETEPTNAIKSMFEKNYIYNRTIEILKEKFPLK